MKKFTVKIMLFLCLLVIPLVLWEHLLGNVTNSYTKKKTQLEALLPAIKVLVLGNSETNEGVNPEYFSLQGYNLANVAQSLFYDKELTLKYIDKLTALKVVMINISYFSLWFEDDGFEHWREYCYYQVWGIKHPSLKSTDLELYSRILLYTPRVPFKYITKGFNVDLAKDVNRYGWEGVNENDVKTDSLGRARATQLDEQCKQVNFKTNCQYLTTLISELEKRNIKVVLFTPPITNVLYNNADKRKLSITDSVMKAVTMNYNCKYLNYIQDRRFVDSDFVNADHLNVNGATKFSKILNADALEEPPPFRP